MKGIVATLAMLVIGGTALAIEAPGTFFDHTPGTSFYRSCLAAAEIVDGKKPTSADASREQLEQAVQCFGVTTAIMNLWPFLKPEFAMCPQGRVTQAQVILVIAAYLRNHPEKLNENFFGSALLALRFAWPCPGDAGR